MCVCVCGGGGGGGMIPGKAKLSIAIRYLFFNTQLSFILRYRHETHSIRGHMQFQWNLRIKDTLGTI